MNNQKAEPRVHRANESARRTSTGRSETAQSLRRPSRVSARIVLFVLICLPALVPTRAAAQTIVSGTTSVASVPRAGVNLTPEAYWSPAVQQNIFANPGFELPQYAQAIGVQTANSTSFTGANTVSGEMNGSWNGATCSVRVGMCSDGTNNYCWNNTTSASTGGCQSGGTCDAGTKFTLSNYTVSNGVQTFTCSLCTGGRQL
jgi:hypothetical protein